MKKLFRYQQEGVDYLLDKKRAILADEMGLGKTVQAAELIRCLFEQKKINNALVVCPASLKINWKRELEDRGLSVETIEKAKDLLATDSVGKVFVITYNIIHKDLPFLQLKAVGAECVICDEAHYLKNPTTLQSKKVSQLAKDVEYCVLITGTPIPNRPIEVYPLLKVVTDLKSYASYYSFARRFANARQMPWGFDVRGASNIKQLSGILDTCMIRRLKKDVLTELPPKTIQTIALPSSPATNKLIKQEKKYSLKDLEKNPEKAMVGEFATLRREQAISKVPQAVKYIKEDVLCELKKVVIFAYHKEVIAQLADKLSDNFGVVTLTGASTAKERQHAVDTFQKDPYTQIFIGQIQAAGTGITLTAASTVIFAEFTWTPSDLAQAIDRCHRIGQKDNVSAIFLTLAKSIDERMLVSNIKKKLIINELL